MSEGPFVYSFVSRGTMILAEYMEFAAAGNNFRVIGERCLQKLPSNNKFIYNYDNYIYSFIVGGGYAYCVVAKESISQQISFALLERMKEDFQKRYGGGRADTAVANSLSKEFGPVIKDNMKYIVDHAEEIESLIKVKAQVSQVKSIMSENIDKATNRGEILTVLTDETERLRLQAKEYKTTGTQIQRKMWFQNMKIKLIILGILLFLALIIWLSVCHGFDCTK